MRILTICETSALISRSTSFLPVHSFTIADIFLFLGIDVRQDRELLAELRRVTHYEYDNTLLTRLGFRCWILNITFSAAAVVRRFQSRC